MKNYTSEEEYKDIKEGSNIIIFLKSGGEDVISGTVLENNLKQLHIKGAGGEDMTIGYSHIDHIESL